MMTHRIPQADVSEIKRQVRAARTFLQELFKSEKEKHTSDVAYINARYKGTNSGKVRPQLDWARLYINLRAGNFQEATDIVEKQFNGSGDTGYVLDQAVKIALTDAIDIAKRKQEDHVTVIGPLDGVRKRQIYEAYKKTRAHEGRNFAKLVMVVLDLNATATDGTDYEREFRAPFQDTFEWIWLKLATAHHNGDQQLEENVKLLQRQFWDNGKFYDKQLATYGPHTILVYCQMLLLTGQFARAIWFLEQRKKRVLAVHFAIVLEHYGLLRTTDSWEDLLYNETNEPLGRINFGRLVSSYVIPFQARQPFFAIQYYFLLRNYSPPGQLKQHRGIGISSQHQPQQPGRGISSLFMFLVAHLLIETKLYEPILGKRKDDGEKTPAEIDGYQRYIVQLDSVRSGGQPLQGYGKANPVISYVANKYEVDGQMIDAIRLFHLADEHNNVLRLLNLELANDTSTGIASGGDELFDLARMIKKQYATNPQVDSRKKNTLEFLLKLFQHRRLFHRGQASYIDAIEVLRQSPIVSGFLPFKTDALASCVGRFDEMAEEVRQQLPTVLHNVMQILSVQYRQYVDPTLLVC